MPGEKSLLPGSWPEGSGYAVHTCKFIYIPGRNDLLKTFGARLMTIEGKFKEPVTVCLLKESRKLVV